MKSCISCILKNLDQSQPVMIFCQIEIHNSLSNFIIRLDSNFMHIKFYNIESILVTKITLVYKIICKKNVIK